MYETKFQKAICAGCYAYFVKFFLMICCIFSVLILALSKVGFITVSEAANRNFATAFNETLPCRMKGEICVIVQQLIIG
jgi:hypothetical protein